MKDDWPHSVSAFICRNIRYIYIYICCMDNTKPTVAPHAYLALPKKENGYPGGLHILMWGPLAKDC